MVEKFETKKTVIFWGEMFTESNFLEEIRKNEALFRENRRELLVGCQDGDSRVYIVQHEQTHSEISTHNGFNTNISAHFTPAQVNIAIYTDFLNFGAQLNSPQESISTASYEQIVANRVIRKCTKCKQSGYQRNYRICPLYERAEIAAISEVADIPSEIDDFESINDSDCEEELSSDESESDEGPNRSERSVETPNDEEKRNWEVVDIQKRNIRSSKSGEHVGNKCEQRPIFKLPTGRSSNNRGGPKNIPSNCESPMDFWKLVLTDELVQILVDSTNDYGISTNNADIANNPTNIHEMRYFLGINLYSSRVSIQL
jgi:hypothetical protein